MIQDNKKQIGLLFLWNMFATDAVMPKHSALVIGQINYKQTQTFIEQTVSIIQSLKDFDSHAKANFHLLPHLFQTHFQHRILEVDRETQEKTPVLYGRTCNSESGENFQRVLNL